jgi:hypothetical protein
MKATVTCLGALVVALALASTSHAQYAPWCGFQRQAPDACRPGFICQNYCGAPYGPNWNVRPPFPPFNGILPPPNWNGGGQNLPPVFPTHPYARGPRDYFMYEGR